MGVVDAGRHFFLGALTLLSHKSTEDYVTCVGDFKDVCASEGKFSLDPFYCMLDGEAAIQNALRQLFTNVIMILMFFFHVMKNCKEHLKGVSEQLKKKILKKIRALHMSRNSIEFQLRLEAFSQFLIEHNLQDFLNYFLSTWVHSRSVFGVFLTLFLVSEIPIMLLSLSTSTLKQSSCTTRNTQWISLLS